MRESVLLRIDEPDDLVLRKPVCRIRGWFAGDDPAVIGKLELRIGDAHVPWQEQERPDVAAANTKLWETGFIFDLDVSQYLYAIQSDELVFTAALPHTADMQLRFSVAPGVRANCWASAAGV